MSITFAQIPSRLRIPGVFIEQTAQLISSGDRQNTALHLGYASGGTAEPDTIYKLGSLAEAYALFGTYSTLAAMAEQHFRLNTGLVLYAAAISPPSASTAATGSISIDEAATADSTLSARIADELIQCSIESGDSASTIAGNLASAINDAAASLVGATFTGDTVELTAQLPGLLGNSIPLVVGYNSEEVPTIAITVTEMAGGSGVPDLEPVIESLGEDNYDYIVTAFTDTNSLETLDTFAETRWHAMAGFNVETLIMYVIADTQANSVTKGLEQNSPFLIPHASGKAPQAPWIWAAAVCAIESDSLTNDPAAPLTGKQISGLKAPKACWNWKLRNELLYNGMSTFTTDRACNVYLEKVITSYKEDEKGIADASYLSVNVPELMRNIRRVQSAYLSSKFTGYKLSDYPEQHASGNKITSADGVRAALIGLYQQDLVNDRAWCTDNDHYKDTITVSRDADNRSRLNYYDEPTMIGQLEIIAGQSQLQHG